MDDPIVRLRYEVEAGPRGRVHQIAAGSGVSLKTLRNLIYGATKTTSYENGRALQAYFDEQDRARLNRKLPEIASRETAA